MRIGIDVDSVLADLTNAVCTQQGWDHSLWTEWDVWAKYGLSSHEEFGPVLDKAWKAWKAMPVQEPDIPALMTQLMAWHTVIVISNRNRKTQPYQMAWLHSQGIPYHVYVGNDSWIPKREFPIDGLLDDNPHEVERFTHRHERLYLRTQPWNEFLVGLPLNVDRVETLAEFVRSMT